MLARHYAHALYQMRQKDVIQNFLALIKEKGHQRLLPSILNEYQNIKKEESEKGSVSIRISEKADKESYEKEISAYAQQMSFKMSDINFIEDSSIIGGFIIETENEEVDCSYRKELVGLYRHLMTVNI